MRWHQPLIELRRSGVRPLDVHLETGAFVPEWQHWADWHPDSARVHIERHDVLDRLDLSFIANCHVSVDGDDEKRVREVYAAAHYAGAARVIATFARRKSDTFETVFILDTAYHLDWSKP